MFCFHNSGKTPAIAYEVYGEIVEQLPSKLAYPKQERALSIDISVQVTLSVSLAASKRIPGAVRCMGM